MQIIQFGCLARAYGHSRALLTMGHAVTRLTWAAAGREADLGVYRPRSAFADEAKST